MHVPKHKNSSLYSLLVDSEKQMLFNNIVMVIKDQLKVDVQYRYQPVLSFWFGHLKNGFPMDNKDLLWWAGTKLTDETIKKRFEPLVLLAKQENLSNWKRNAKSCLALIILLDQFPRNIYRGTPKAFANDSQAQILCLQGIAEDYDKALAFIERVFFYLPLEHSENLAHQNLYLDKLKHLLMQVPKQYQGEVESFIKSGRQHRKLIKQFGRFPYRNALLGRPSTQEEYKYLKTTKSQM